MKISFLEGTKYLIKSTSNFNRDLRKVYKQGKNISRLTYVVEKIANGEKLEAKYKNHKLSDNKYYSNCFECHIEPDWLLIYQYNNDELILLLVSTGSHSDLF